MDKIPKTEKLTIYLIRNGYIEDKSFIKIDSAKKPISLAIPGIDQATLYIKQQAEPKRPKWVSFFTDSHQVDESIFGYNSHVAAVLVVRMSERIFVLSFGMGRFLIELDRIERDFGLKVTLNSVDPQKLKSVDKTDHSVSNPLISRNQSSKLSNLNNLDVDEEMEFLNSLTGESKIEGLGTVISGRDSLTIFINSKLINIYTIIEKVKSLYEKKIPTEFEWIENIYRIKDPEIIELLDSIVDDRIRNNELDSMWLAEPEIVSWEDQVGYSFSTAKNATYTQTLDLKSYITYRKNTSTEQMKKDKVYTLNLDYNVIRTWSIYRCLYAEVNDNNEQYILRNGDWYSINNKYLDTLNECMSKIKPYDFSFPIYDKETEYIYNKEVATAHKNIEIMDQEFIYYGGSYSKNEHCDLIKDSKEFIHVKLYRGSSSISHLFAQGLIASEAFIFDELYRMKLNDKLPEHIQLENPHERPEPSQYKIVYAIAANRNFPKDLPFFSKVTLKNTLKRLQGLGYKVRVAMVPVDQDTLNIIKGKPEPDKPKVSASA
ncbi:sporadically distributed protein, TIGR04141 family [Vibrio parahaemolyticus]|uniref:TIGR04141 family sporadically distributed protein n=1 Tax=Vibrio parahaemolyticus TaxID=670 RepID=UPI00040B99D8|nr:TIGR04141 family sporadically distributed protein [Vibrio parahaemolyticus]EGR3257455.1 sporadically distributed protein, TIGR04141 family [Vibrio parahaemolyticus]KOY28482.1 hypothetical protein ACX12_03095 [Vibrio parahaemolyticus]KYY06573.1 hypothetical protein AWQ10_17300 [Vibrio parahaemolyticus]OXD51808.1 sporadically distributed protein, TIGR04141 family [Vibrio parahaemolyticus]OXD53425.1 sporadically distributed protein, TIGR04141 family [Vibrio parahaemolyticus]